MIEKNLINDLKNGREKALEPLYDRYGEKIFNVAVRFGLKDEDAVEIVQDVFVKVWEKRKDLRLDLSFNAYLLTITKNFIIKKARKNATDVAFQKYYSRIQQVGENSTEDLIVYADLFKLTDGFIDSLPQQQREIFRMNKIEHLSHNEISKKLNLSVRTVENHVFRATLNLKQKLREVGIILELSLILGCRWFL